MALSMEDLVKIEGLLASASDADLFGELRRQFPALFFIQCDASDMTEAPFAGNARLDIHLVDSADHCVRITADPARATGVVLARRSATP